MTHLDHLLAEAIELFNRTDDMAELEQVKARYLGRHGQLTELLKGLGKIPPDEQLEPGRVLARMTDLGWGGRLRGLLAPESPDAECPPEILRACVQVLAQWDWSQRPGAVVAVPSRSRPLFTETLARGLAEIGRLPYLGALGLRRGGPSGNAGGNSTYRLAGVWDRFEAGGLDVRSGVPVLLVDDVIDSRWTITVAGRELRRAGAGGVLPFAAALRA